MMKAIFAVALGTALFVQMSTTPAAQDDLTRLNDFTAARVSSNNPDPESNDDSWRPIAGETVTLADLDGPGVVTHVWLTVAANEYGWPRLLRLRVYYDGNPVPSVDCPVGDFFAVGHGFERSINSIMIRNSSNGRSRNSYWQMPFAKHVRITVTNEGRRRVANLYFHVDWKKVSALPPDTVYFHARYRQALPAEAGQPYEILSTIGRGHYVGTVLSVIQNEAGWFGEGDERFYVDGETKPSIEGTGTEDYFNDAWSFRVADALYTGVPVAEGTGVGARMTAYRWHVVDPVPFRQSFKLNIEHRGWTYNADGSVRSAFEERPDLFSSVAFWYQSGVASDQPQVPYGSRRLPLGNARQIEVENSLADVVADGGKASVQKDVFWSKDLLFFEAKGPGSKMTIPFDVTEEGRYEIVAQVADSADYGTYVTELDGKSTSTSESLEHEPGANTGESGRIDAYAAETYVAEDRLIGWAKLTRGRHTLTFVCTGKNVAATGFNLGVDTLILSNLSRPSDPDGARAAAVRAIGERRSSDRADLDRTIGLLSDPAMEVREAAAWTLGQVSVPPGTTAVAALAHVLDDPDPVARGLAALALRNIGAAASPAREALLTRLDDPEPAVKMMAAQAIGRLRDPAAIDRLVQTARVQGQDVQVLRSVADALGDLGPQASRALPALRELARIPRVAWAANAAIRKIEPR